METLFMGECYTLCHKLQADGSIVAPAGQIGRGGLLGMVGYFAAANFSR
jgi:hypothetical protein